MSTVPASAPYRARIWRNQRGELHFTLAECPKCKQDFRLLWPCSVLTYPERATLHLECPGCRHAFASKDLRNGKLYHVACGCERCPAAPVIWIED